MQALMQLYKKAVDGICNATTQEGAWREEGRAEHWKSTLELRVERESGYNERLEFLSSVPNIHEFSLQCTNEQTNLWPSSWLQQLCRYLKMFGLGFITVSLIDAEQRRGW